MKAVHSPLRLALRLTGPALTLVDAQAEAQPAPRTPSAKPTERAGEARPSQSPHAVHEGPRKFLGAPPEEKAGLSRPRTAQRSGASTARERQASEASLGEGIQ
jgi:hypothetical protein